MELKKSKDSNTEKLKVSNALIGLLYISSIILASFSYGTLSEDDSKGKLKTSKSKDAFEENVEQEEPPPPPEIIPPKVEIPPPVTAEIDSVDNEEEEINLEVEGDVSELEDLGGEEEEIEVEEEILEFVDVDASFPGGIVEMRKFIRDNVDVPDICTEMSAMGRVFVKFCVEKDGSITNVTLERNATGCDDYFKACKNVLRKMPKWIPGEASGASQRSWARIPFSFEFN
tara:strand:+ start:2152 stop:2838 length:687 start_codon:yes stop_codon:yes gene_type:complete